MAANEKPFGLWSAVFLGIGSMVGAGQRGGKITIFHYFKSIKKSVIVMQPLCTFKAFGLE